MIYPKSFDLLLEDFQRFPGVGQKSAERFVYAVENLSEEDIKKFSKDLINFKLKIKKCKICGHYSDEEKCKICEDKSRNNGVICVVADSKSVFAIEKAGVFNGLYHVLNGLISPSQNIYPEDININSLINSRITEEITEIILALNPSVEGETTSLYLQKLLEKKNVKISRLSYGIPVGTDIEYLDSIVFSKALEDRKIIS